MSDEARLDLLLAGFDPGASTCRSDAVIDLLREGIISGTLPPGMVLRQDRVAQAIGISKIPLREALAKLEIEGFVTSTPGRGVAVSAVSSAQVQEIFLLRNLMEVELLAAAIPHMTLATFTETEAAIRDFETAPVAQLSRINWRIHSALYRPAGRALSLEILRGLFLHAERYVQIHMSTLDQDRSANQDHLRLLEACAHGRTGEACGILRDHLNSIGKTICDYAAKESLKAAAKDA